MRQHPILFSGEMVEAIFAKRKSQTRRLAGLEVINQEPDRYEYIGLGGGFDAPFLSFHDRKEDVQVIVKSRYGTAGHLLWVRETWQAQEGGGKWWHEVKKERELYNWAFTNPVRPAYESVPPRWLPGIHMPEMACRLWRKVEGIRAERLQDIRLNDIEAEGVIYEPTEAGAALEKWRDVWNRINGNWNLNPWVIVVVFDV